MAESAVPSQEFSLIIVGNGGIVVDFSLVALLGWRKGKGSPICG
jgi:hypothetical protein